MRMHYLTKDIQESTFYRSPIPETKEDRLLFFAKRIAELEDKIASMSQPSHLIQDTLKLNKKLFEIVKAGR